MLRLRRQQQRLDAERREDVAVGRIARRRQRDAIAGIEGGEEGDEEAGRGAGGHHDAARIEVVAVPLAIVRSEEHTSELQSLMRISYAVFCLKKKKIKQKI